jgi:hypothetical protein
MAAIDFPVPSFVGQTYTTAGGIKYIWDGVSWVSQGGGYLTTADIASSAQWMAAYTGKILGTDATWGGAAPVTLAQVAGHVTPDMSQFINGVVQLSGTSNVLDNPLYPKPGQTGWIEQKQPASGGPCIQTYGSFWKPVSNVAPVLSTAASASDILFYAVLSATRIFYSLSKAVP